MPYDGIVMHSVVQSLQILIGQRVDKIYQPEEDEVQLQLRMKDKRRLKFSINPSMPYMTLTKVRKVNPETPPNFLILLRKHLQGAILREIRQTGNDRIVHFVFGGRSELGDQTQLTLVYELMGRHSNLVLLDQDDKIIDSLKRVPPYMSQVRQILPGLDFLALPSHQIDPWTMSYEDFNAALSTCTLPIRKALYVLLQGLSPAVSTELLDRQHVDPGIEAASLDSEMKTRVFLALKNLSLEGCFIFKDSGGFYKDFHLIDLSAYPSRETREDLLELIDDFYSGKDLQLRVRQHSGDLRKLLENRMKRSASKIEALESELATARDAESLKLMGELLLANLHRMERGMESITVDNYYTGEQLEISLDLRKTPQENSQAYYKQYNKAKAATVHLESQIHKAKSELDYFESILSAISNTLDLDNLEMIKDELIQQGYVKKKGYRKEKKKLGEPHVFISESGFEILVGKNNIQNDRLTFKTASNSDIWLHTKDIPGSHVIISCKGKDVDEATLVTAAQLAAFFSKARHSSKVPVDYTQVRHVKKPSGAKPGFVNYFHQHTLYVTPDEDALMRMQSNQR